MNLSFVKHRFLSILLIQSLLLSACTKIVTTDIGGSLLPPVDNVNTKEMFLDIVSKNGKDSTTTVGTQEIQSLGYLNDPLFGKTNASVNVELKPDAYPVTFPVQDLNDSLMLDSVVLVLRTVGSYGDTLQDLKLRVYEMSKEDTLSDLKPTTYYKTNYQVAHGTELTTGPLTVNIPSLDDSVAYTFGGKNANVIRVRLSNEYGNRLLHDYDTSNAYKSDSLFEVNIKGLQVVPESQGNAFVRINLVDTNTQLALYYRYKRRDSAGKVDTTVLSFRCNTFNCGSTNYVTRDRSSGQVASFLSSLNTDKNDSLIFIDANPGIYAMLSIPNTDTLSNKIIHRAEIMMEQVPDLSGSGKDDVYLPPNIFVTTYDVDSMRRFAQPNDMTISNGTVSNQANLGSFPLKKIDPASGRTIYEYKWDVSRYLQGIITFGQKYYDLVMWAPYNDYVYLYNTPSSYQVFTGAGSAQLNRVATGRIRLGGASNTSHKMKLHIVYSDIH